jgi:hypothetical protein
MATMKLKQFLLRANMKGIGIKDIMKNNFIHYVNNNG